MGFDQGTIQALDVISGVLERQDTRREADKDRAGRLLEFKIREDEREADRLTDRLIRLEQENFEMDKEFTVLTGMASKLKALEKEADYEGQGDGTAAIGEAQSNLAMDRESLRTRISEATDQRETLLGSLSQFYEAYNRVAPEQFDRFKTSGEDQTLTGISGIEDDEFKLVQEDLARQGVEMTPEMEAGLRRRFQELGDSTFSKELEEEKLRMSKLMLRLKARAGSKDDPVAKQFNHELRTRILGLNRTSESFELDGAIPGIVPLTSQTTFGDISQSLANIVANFVSRGDKVDRGDPLFGLFAETPEEMQKAISSFKNSVGDAKNAAAMDIMLLMSQNPDKFVMGFDFEGMDLFGRSSEHASGEPGFVGEAVSIFSSISQFESDRFFASPEGRRMIDALDQNAGQITPLLETETQAEDEVGDGGVIDFLSELGGNVTKFLDETTIEAKKAEINRKAKGKNETLLHRKAFSDVKQFIDDLLR